VEQASPQNASSDGVDVQNNTGVQITNDTGDLTANANFLALVGDTTVNVRRSLIALTALTRT
jgi:hypothetical protein